MFIRDYVSVFHKKYINCVRHYFLYRVTLKNETSKTTGRNLFSLFLALMSPCSINL